MNLKIKAKFVMRKVAKKIGHGAHILVPKEHVGKELIVIEEEKE